MSLSKCIALSIQLCDFRCKCEFYYVAYGESSLEQVTDRIPRRPEVTPWSGGHEDEFVNAFSLIHHDLDVFTNSLQYSMILDVLNNLLLYIEPSFRSRTENYLRMKYQLMLSKVEDQRKPIVQLHTQIRQMVCQLRVKEKAIFALQSAIDERWVWIHISLSFLSPRQSYICSIHLYIFTQVIPVESGLH